MVDYLVLADHRLSSFGIASRLIYSGPKGYYIIEHQDNPGKTRYFHIRYKLGESTASHTELLEEYFKRNSISSHEKSQFEIFRLETVVGARYGRIHRPARGFGSILFDNIEDIERTKLVDLYSQFDSYNFRLSEISRILKISRGNFDAYGDEIRNLLILACTEVELLFKRLIWIDYENIHSGMHKFFLVNQYAFLSESTVRFNRFPEVGELCPFAAWHQASEYVPLEWYRSYNATKHSRKSGEDGANLRAVLMAIAACAILIKKQTPMILFGTPKPFSVENFNSNFVIKEPSLNMGQMYWVLPGRKPKILEIPGIA